MDPAATPPHSAAERHSERIRKANGVYGVIISSAVMAATPGTTVGRVTAAVIITLVVYWAAERYSHLMASLIVDGERLSWREVARDLRDGWKLVTASFAPLLVMITTYLLGASHSTAVLVALLFSTALLLAIGWRAGRAAGIGLLGSLASAAVAGMFGVVMIVLKMALH